MYPREDSIDLSRDLLEVAVGEGGLCPTEDAGDVALGLLIAPVVLLSRLLVSAAWMWHGGVDMRVGWSRALLLLRLLRRGRRIWLLQLLVVAPIPAVVVVVVETAAVAILVGLAPASSTATTATPEATPATGS